MKDSEILITDGRKTKEIISITETGEKKNIQIKEIIQKIKRMREWSEEIALPSLHDREKNFLRPLRFLTPNVFCDIICQVLFFI